MNIKNIPIKFISSFLLGYFDGDGCITHNKNKKELPSSYAVNICGTESAMSCISKKLDMLGLDYSLKDDKRMEKYNGKFQIIAFNNIPDKYCFLKTLYDNNKDIKKLTRKENRVKHFLKLVENNATNRNENIKALEKYAVIRQNYMKSYND